MKPDGSDAEKVQLQHPEGKNMPRIDTTKYAVIHQGIIDVLEKNGEMKPMKMLHALDEHLRGRIDGSITWYGESVKLDMQAKGELVHNKKKGFLWFNN